MLHVPPCLGQVLVSACMRYELCIRASPIVQRQRPRTTRTMAAAAHAGQTELCPVHAWAAAVRSPQALVATGNPGIDRSFRPNKAVV